MFESSRLRDSSRSPLTFEGFVSLSLKATTNRRNAYNSSEASKLPLRVRFDSKLIRIRFCSPVSNQFAELIAELCFNSGNSTKLVFRKIHSPNDHLWVAVADRGAHLAGGEI